MLDESVRDVDENDFTPILRSLRKLSPLVAAAVFVDEEGECIDYVSALSPYETKIVAATLRVTVSAVASALGAATWGAMRELEVGAGERNFLMCRVAEGYWLVVVANCVASGIVRHGAREVAKLLAAESGFRKANSERAES